MINIGKNTYVFDENTVTVIYMCVNRREFVKYDTHKLKLGRQYLIKLELEHNESIQMHKMVVTTDLYNTPTVSEHTWGPLKRRTGYEDPVEAYTDTDASKDISEDISEDTIEDIKLRVMTYNIWHNNPPSWLVHDKYATHLYLYR